MYGRGGIERSPPVAIATAGRARGDALTINRSSQCHLQKGITYFVVGSGGQLRKGNIDRTSGLTASGFDTDLSFMAAEIAGDEMFFNAISRQGAVVDSGVLTRRKAADAGR